MWRSSWPKAPAQFLTPAKAGVHADSAWMPAFAGMTEEGLRPLGQRVIPREPSSRSASPPFRLRAELKPRRGTHLFRAWNMPLAMVPRASVVRSLRDAHRRDREEDGDDPPVPGGRPPRAGHRPGAGQR